MKQYALITGAGTGIGRALSERLIKKNHEVIGVGRRPAPLEKLKQDFGKSVTIVEADIGTVSGRNKIHSVVKKIRNWINWFIMLGFLIRLVRFQK